MTPVEQIKSRLDITEVVGGYVKLQRAGVNLKARCPFHNEKTPSFFVSPTRQTWHCFGCNKGGDIFSFVQEIEGMEFAEALRVLAQRAGVELSSVSKEKRDTRAQLFSANDLAAQFFATQLQKSASGAKARAYLHERGLTEDTIAAFGLGWAPESSDALVTFLRSRDFSFSDIAQAGLSVPWHGGVRARFRGRIMFPIRDGSNRVIGFTGRIFGREEGEYDPKYLNTPETPIFEKHRVLYALHFARKEIRKKGSTVLVEGQMDCVMAHQAGTGNAVATSGTALTQDHIALLKRLADTLILAYDADVAGVEAAKRGIELALEAGLMVRLAIVPHGKDPAEFIHNDANAWRELLERNTKPVIGFLLEQALLSHDTTTPEGKRAVAEAVFPVLARMSNVVERAEWLEETRKRLGLTQTNAEELWQEVSRRAGKQGAIRKTEAGNAAEVLQKPLSRRELLEEHLVALAFLLAEPFDFNEEAIFRSAFRKELYRAAQGVGISGKNDAAAISEQLLRFREAVREELRPHADRIAFIAEEMVDMLHDSAREIASCIREIQAFDLREQLDALSTELEVAERMSDTERIRELTERFRLSSANLAALFREEKKEPEAPPSELRMAL